MTIAEALRAASCLRAVSDSWRLDAELLLAEITGRSRVWLLAHSEESLPVVDRERYQSMLERRADGEPLAYLVGRKEFWDFELQVDQRVLVPRPETERLVEVVLQHPDLPAESELSLADLGTGSGAIAIAFARERPRWQILAIEQDQDALALARANAERLVPGRIRVHRAAWCAELPSNSLDILVSNPPYVDSNDPHLRQDGLRFEPRQALVAASNGLADLFGIIDQARRVLKKDAWLFLEHGYEQQSELEDRLRSQGYQSIGRWQDAAGRDRVIGAQWPA